MIDLNNTSCTKCGLCKLGSKVVHGLGNSGAKILLVDDYPSLADDRAGSLLMGPAGERLKQILYDSGLSLSDVYITCLVKHCPKIYEEKGWSTRSPSAEEIAICAPYLEAEIAAIKPSVIVPMGNIALSYFVEQKRPNIMKHRGIELDFPKYNCKLLPMINPKSLLKNPHHLEITLQDLKRIKISSQSKELLQRKEGSYITIDTREKFDAFIERISQVDQFAYDIETTGFDFLTDKLLCVAFSWKEGTGCTIPITRYTGREEEYTELITKTMHRKGKDGVIRIITKEIPKVKTRIIDSYEDYWKEDQAYVLQKLKEIFALPSLKIAHNGKFDNKFLVREGMPITNFNADTMLSHYLLNENAQGMHGLKDLAWSYTDMGGYDKSLEDWFKERKITNDDRNYARLPIDLLYPYNAMDADCTLRLWKAFKPKLEAEGLTSFFERLIMPLSDTLMRAETHGLLLDQTYLQKLRVELTTEQEALLAQIKAKVGDINPKSPVQLRELLFSKLKLPIIKKTDKGQSSTDEEVLEELAKRHEVPKLLLDFRKGEKILTTYVVGLSDRLKTDARIHTSFLIHGTTTGRLSSQNPNMQNIPKKDKRIKRLFIAPPGHTLVEADYGQCFAGDTLIRTLQGHLPIKEVVERFNKGEQFQVYCYDKKSNETTIKPIVAGVMSGIKETVTITLDNGAKIQATPNHKFIRKTGEDVSVEDLLPGDSLLPFYEREKTKNWYVTYRDIYCETRGWVSEHRLICSDHLHHTFEKNEVVHHKDHNGLNNSLENLLICSRNEHHAIHSREAWSGYRAGKRSRKNPDVQSFSKAVSKGVTKWWKNASEEDKQTRIERLRKGIQGNPPKGSKNGMWGKSHSEQARLKQSEAKQKIKGVLSEKFRGDNNPAKRLEVRNKMSVSIKQAYTRPDLKYRRVIQSARTVYNRLDGRGLPLTQENWKSLRKSNELTWDVLQKYIKNFPHLFPFLPWNHKVVKIEPGETLPVYNITVADCHTYALSAGIFVNNCEFRIWAHYSSDAAMIADIRAATDGTGPDIHILTASSVHKIPVAQVTADQRQQAKAVVFGLMYGRGAKSLAEEYSMSEEQALKIIKTFKGRYPQAAMWLEYAVKTVQTHGQIRNAFGRLRRIPGISSTDNEVRSEAQRQSVNSPIQSAASDMNCNAANRIKLRFAERGLRGELGALIHDALVYEIPNEQLRESIEVIQAEMERPIEGMTVPLQAELQCGDTWGTVNLIVKKNDQWVKVLKEEVGENGQKILKKREIPYV